MSEKVKVTRKHSELIESFKEDYRMNFAYMPYEIFVHALKDGYEVEEHKHGDWVLINRHGDNWVAKIQYISPEKTTFKPDYDIHVHERYYAFSDIERHATKEEIEHEKKSRFWEKLDRKVDEYRVGDIVDVQYFGAGILVKVAEVLRDSIIAADTWFPKNETKLVTPVEKRLDK